MYTSSTIWLLKWCASWFIVLLLKSLLLVISMFTTCFEFHLLSLVNRSATLLSSKTLSSWRSSQSVFLTTLQIRLIYLILSEPLILHSILLNPLFVWLLKPHTRYHNHPSSSCQLSGLSSQHRHNHHHHQRKMRELKKMKISGLKIRN